MVGYSTPVAGLGTGGAISLDVKISRLRWACGQPDPGTRCGIVEASLRRVTVPPLEPGEAAQVRILAGGLAGADPLAERLSPPETAS